MSNQPSALIKKKTDERKESPVCIFHTRELRSSWIFISSPEMSAEEKVHPTRAVNHSMFIVPSKLRCSIVSLSRYGETGLPPQIWGSAASKITNTCYISRNLEKTTKKSQFMMEKKWTTIWCWQNAKRDNRMAKIWEVKARAQTTENCTRQTMVKVCQMASRAPILKLLLRFKITKLINLKYEYFADRTCANLRNMNFANKF